MNWKKVVLVFAVVVAIAVADGEESSSTDKDIPIQPSPSPSTTTIHPPPPPTTTTTTTTTTKPPTTKTTTTAKPSPPPITTATTPKTTTTVPTKPTTAPTTVKPTPSPKPEPPKTGEWSANYTGTNVTCLVAKMAIQIDVPVPAANTTLKINVPANATGLGDCNSTVDEEWLTVGWGDGHSVHFVYKKEANKTRYELAQVDVKLNLTLDGKNYSIVTLSNSTTEFETPLDYSYKCGKEQSLPLSGTVLNGSLHISDVQFEAFRHTAGHQFSTAKDCEGSQTPDVVPIAVGCVLVALIVLILVGYLFGRRRCQARGYLSM